MKPEIARQFHQVVGYGLDLMDRLDRGEQPPLDHELTQLKGLLLGPSVLRNDADFAGDVSSSTDLRSTTSRGGKFLGARYALTCWLDEIFIADSPYAEKWKEKSLETEIFQARDRAEGFWDQATLAEKQSGSDALEVYYWCVMLGFRGKFREQPDKLRSWVDGIRARIRTAHRAELSLPADQGFTTFVPKLTGIDRFGAMIRVAAAVSLLAVPLLVFLIMRLAAEK